MRDVSPISRHSDSNRSAIASTHRRRSAQRTAPCSASGGSQTATPASAPRELPPDPRECGVAPRERGTIPLQRREISGYGEREHDIEKAPPRARRSGYELDVGRREHHRRKSAKRVAQTFRHAAVEPHALLLSRALESDTDVVTAIRLYAGPHVKTVGAKSHEVLVSRPTHGPENLQVVNRFKKICLALSVLPNHDKAVGGHSQVEMGEVTKVSDGQANQARRGATHTPVKLAGRFSRNARVPSFSSAVAANSPKAVASSVSASASGKS